METQVQYTVEGTANVIFFSKSVENQVKLHLFKGKHEHAQDVETTSSASQVEESVASAYHHFWTPVKEIDPSINYTAARSVFQAVKREVLDCFDSYTDVILNRDASFKAVLKLVNQAHCVYRLPNLGKVFFLEYTQEAESFLGQYFDEISVTLPPNGDQPISNDVLTLFSQVPLTEYLVEACSEKKAAWPKFAVLKAEDAQRSQVFQEGLYLSYYQNERESWEVIHVYKGTFPTDLETYKGFVITGSHHNVHDGSVEWIVQFGAWLKDVVDRRHNGDLPNLRIAGVCFGMQALAHFNGGKCEPYGNGHVVKTLEQFQFTEDYYRLPYLARSKYHQEYMSKTKAFYGVESHEDHVVKLPNEATLLASSPTTGVNVYGIKDFVLAYQPHPEYNYTIHRAFMRSYAPKELIAIADNSFHIGQNTNTEVNDVIDVFLKH